MGCVLFTAAVVHKNISRHVTYNAAHNLDLGITQRGVSSVNFFNAFFVFLPDAQWQGA